jgi:hypothetical protein
MSAQKMNVDIDGRVDVNVRRLTSNSCNRASKFIGVTIPSEEKLILAARIAPLA